MVIEEMSHDECLKVLAGAKLARLACAHENQPYVVPVYLTYDMQPGGKPCLYGFTTPGQKVRWMRANPLVCIEVDDVTAQDHWVSVIAFGRFEELRESSGDPGILPIAHQVFEIGRHQDPENVGSEAQSLNGHQDFQRGRHEDSEAPGRDDERLRAHEILQSQAVWWEPAYAAYAGRADRDQTEPFAPVYYRVCLDRVTGHRASPDPRTVNDPAAPLPHVGWLQTALRFLRRPLMR